MTNPSGDPVFQLNSVLWMLQPLPDRPGAPNPVLYDSGYRVRSLGKPLTADAETERRLATELDLKGVPAPDVLASAEPGVAWPVFECKRSSFGVESSTSDQATKILARAKDLSIVAGDPPGSTTWGCVDYVTRKDQAADLHRTLEVLATRLAENGMEPAPSATIALDVATGVGATAVVADGDLPGPAGEALANRAVVIPAAGEGEDARPLYLVPFDPSVEQDEEERRICLRVLLARGRAHAASVIGREPAPGTAILEGSVLLAGATYGLSRYWADHGARDAAASEILKFVKAALRGMKDAAPKMIEGSSPRRVEMTLHSEDQRQACAEAIIASPLPGEPTLTTTIEEELPFADTPT